MERIQCRAANALDDLRKHSVGQRNPQEYSRKPFGVRDRPCGVFRPRHCISRKRDRAIERRELLRLSVGALLTGTLGSAVAPVLARNTATAAEDVVASERYNRERRFLTTPHGRIAYIDRGTGTAVLFLHGFPLSSFQWRGAIERLSSDRRCIAPDLMGLGYTEVAENQSVAPAAQVDMITALLDGLSIQKVDLIANDSGGAIAQLFVTNHRDRVRTLLLTNCDVETDSPPAALLPVIELARDDLYADLWLLPWVEHKDVARSEKGLGEIATATQGTRRMQQSSSI